MICFCESKLKPYFVDIGESRENRALRLSHASDTHILPTPQNVLLVVLDTDDMRDGHLVVLFVEEDEPYDISGQVVVDEALNVLHSLEVAEAVVDRLGRRDLGQKVPRRFLGPDHERQSAEKDQNDRPCPQLAEHGILGEANHLHDILQNRGGTLTEAPIPR